MKKRVEIEQAAFAFEKRRRDCGAVRMGIGPVAMERVFAEANFYLVGCFSGRETGSIIALEAVLPEAVAAEGETSETLAEEATLPEAMPAKAAVPEAVASLEIPAPRSAMASEPDFREGLGGGRLEVVADRRRRRQRRIAERSRLGRHRVQDSQHTQEETQGQTHRAEYSSDRHGWFLPFLSASCLLATAA